MTAQEPSTTNVVPSAPGGADKTVTEAEAAWGTVDDDGARVPVLELDQQASAERWAPVLIDMPASAPDVLGP